MVRVRRLLPCSDCLRSCPSHYCPSADGPQLIASRLFLPSYPEDMAKARFLSFLFAGHRERAMHVAAFMMSAGGNARLRRVPTVEFERRRCFKTYSALLHA